MGLWNSEAISTALTFKGVIDCHLNPNYPIGVTGDLYIVSVGGKIGGGSGIAVSAGDQIICITNNAGGTQAGVGVDWSIAFVTLGNVITGPGVSVDGNLMAFDGILGNVAQDTGIAFDSINTAFTNNLKTKIDDYDITVADSTIYANTTTKSFALTLPDATTCPGRIFIIKKIVAGNILTIAPQPGQNIEGQSSLTINNVNVIVWLQSNSNNWYILG